MQSGQLHLNRPSAKLPLASTRFKARRTFPTAAAEARPLAYREILHVFEKPAAFGNRLTLLAPKGESTLKVEGSRPQVSIDTVLYATGLSGRSSNAAAYARLLARYFSAKLMVANVFHPSQAAMEAEALTHHQSKEREANFARVARVARDLSADGIEAQPVLLEGAIEQAIAAYADQHAPSLVVLSTSGAGRLQRAFVGSTADRILRSTRWPCFVVGPNVLTPSKDCVPFKRILYATDFSPAAAQAALYAVALARDSGADIDVMNVVPKAITGSADHFNELESRLHHDLQQVIPDQAREFCSPHTFVDIGNAHERINEHIRQYSADLLVIGVRKSSHLDLEMRTSDAFGLISGAHCPVLTILA